MDLKPDLNQLVQQADQAISKISSGQPGDIVDGISAQRAFEAGTKTVKTQDEIYETLLNTVNPADRRGRAFEEEA